MSPRGLTVPWRRWRAGFAGDGGGRPSLDWLGTVDELLHSLAALVVVPSLGLVIRESCSARLPVQPEVFATPDAIAMAAMPPSDGGRGAGCAASPDAVELFSAWNFKGEKVGPGRGARQFDLNFLPFSNHDSEGSTSSGAVQLISAHMDQW
jgi:hypothetical protein